MGPSQRSQKKVLTLTENIDRSGRFHILRMAHSPTEKTEALSLRGRNLLDLTRKNLPLLISSWWWVSVDIVKIKIGLIMIKFNLCSCILRISIQIVCIENWITWKLLWYMHKISERNVHAMYYSLHQCTYVYFHSLNQCKHTI